MVCTGSSWMMPTRRSFSPPDRVPLIHILPLFCLVPPDSTDTSSCIMQLSRSCTTRHSPLQAEKLRFSTSPLHRFSILNTIWSGPVSVRSCRAIRSRTWRSKSSVHRRKNGSGGFSAPPKHFMICPLSIRAARSHICCASSKWAAT